MRTFLLVALLAVSAMAAPAPRADFALVKELVGELRSEASAAIQAIKDTANNDNVQVGQTISAKLDEASTAALLVLAEAEKLIDDMTLTVEKAQELLQGLLADIGALREELADDIAQLSEAAQTTISEILVAALETGTAIAEEIYGALAARQARADFAAVKELVQELRNKATAAITAIKSAAITDNPTVGQTIADKLDVASAAALEVLAEAEGLIDDMTLTVEKAQELLQGLLADIEALREELAADIAQLTEQAQADISAILTSALAEATEIANKIYDALAARQSRADYPAVKALVDELRTKASAALQAVKDAANADNPTVGATMAEKIDAAAAQALAILAEADAQITDETLTVEQARAYLQQVEAIIEGLRGQLASELTQLSEATQAAISQILADGLVEAKRIAEAIYDALAAFLARADFPAVKALVDELRTKASAALQAVKDAANADNPTVGATMAEKIDAAAAQALAILAEADAQITDETLTVEQARTYLQQVEAIIEALRGQLASELTQLSEATQAAISQILADGLVEAKRIADEIYAALA